MTPNNHDDLSSDLGRALHDRADGLVGAPITLSDVKGRASRIRRRRAVAASAAVAAAVAIIVPTAIVGSDMFDSSSDGGVANPSPNPTETTGDAQSWPQKLDLTDLELGALPSVPWVEDGTYHGAGELPLPGSGYGWVARFDDGWIVSDSRNDGTYVLVLDAVGEVVREFPSTDAHRTFVVSDDGTEVLYVEGDELRIHDNTTGDDTVIGSGHSGSAPIGVEDGIAYYNVDPSNWPMDGRRWDGEAQDLSPGTRVPYTNVSGDGATTVLSSADDFGSCSSLWSESGNALGETCDFTLDGFSPDGGHLLAGPSYRDGFGDGEIAVLPADGAAIEDSQVVFHYQRKGDLDPFFLESIWEDDEHVLAVTFTPSGTSAKGTWQIVRIGLDGTVENAVEPIEANDLNGPFSLPDPA